MRRLFAVVFLLVLMVTKIGVVGAAPISSDELKAIINWQFYDPESVASCTSTGSPTLPEGSKVYIVGDSITYGAKPRYISKFNDKNITAVVNGSVGRSITGAGTSGGTLKTNGIDAVKGDAAAVKEAKSIVVALGTNGGNTDQNVQTMIQTIQEINSSATIYWVNVIGTNRAAMMPVMRDANRAIENNLKRQGMSYDPIINWFNAVSPDGDPINPAEYEPDPKKLISTSDGLNVHPTAAGYDALTDLLISRLTGQSTTGTSGATCYSGGGILKGNTNAEKIWNFFKDRGLSPVQAAGFMGNLQAEAHFDPKLVQYGKPKASGGISRPCPQDSGPDDPTCHDDTLIVDGQSGYGIAQWTSRGRQQALLDFSRSKGTIAGDLNTQLEFLWIELTTSYAGSVLNPLKAVGPTGIREATDIVLKKFECPQACADLAKDPSNPALQAAYQAVLNDRTILSQGILTEYGSL